MIEVKAGVGGNPIIAGDGVCRAEEPAMTDPKLPSRRALRFLAILAAAVAFVWVVAFVGENISHTRIKAEQERTGGGVPRGS
ncbi:hypothetical protein J2Y58_002874 [Sphingomonas sp. BE138]|uniref:hypothetical protein n=1 Tax=Sphingomonas sp. BE138 TaxID=2817845 RepID=UPI00286485A3|nr:hypothetical protein [Sphingomonas sp. BE138]MDR6789501.1 hypothetical protein [Sphingomonas sp. BE138]